MSDTISELENGARSPVASGSSDPASSLRAAALLTLKTKRRKPVVDTSGSPGPFQRPPPTDTSLQLDYGQEDIGSSPTDVAMPPAPLKAPHPGNEDGQTREEGEISDSEDSPSKQPKPAPDPTIVKVESPTHNLLDRTRDPRLSLTPVSLGEHVIDADHVRPGLSMNQDQYDTAKDIVLDLLGWGVPPDYLVDCNLSREIVYYVFSELNLRLPNNLDTAGLIPYTPAHVAIPPEAPVSSRPLHGHPSLPPKPLAGSNAPVDRGPSPAQRSATSPPPHTSSPPIPLSPTSQQPSATGSLHDMERQRRQELLARKAVQASRKIKPPSDASSTASSSYMPADQSGVQDQDVEMAPAVATEAVDDFLKSIGEKSVTPEALTQPEAIDTMDVDETPGLAGSMSSFYGAESHRSQTPTYTDQVVISPADSSFGAVHAQSQSEPPPSSGESGSTVFGLEPASYDEQLSYHQALQRRGAKRPTAADFVDFDSSSRNGYHNGAMPNPLRRKTASFASVSGHRKLVIDLSDSEGEGGEDYAMHDSTESERWEGGSGYSSPAPGRYPLSAVGAGWGTPPPTSGTMTPAALMEKEQEIRKMRELIAQREQSRMQKAMSRTSSIPMSTESPRLEDDTVPLANGSAAPPPNNGYHSRHHEDGTIPAALTDKRALTTPILAGSTTTSASTTPPNIDPQEMIDQNGGADAITTGAQDSATAKAASQAQPVNGNGVSTQEAFQEPVAGLVDVDSASSSSAQVRLANSIPDDTSPPKTRRKSSNIAGPRQQI
ncbi:hypothetical protein B0H17DRAFT_1054987 [Mycena rosella]|uniref:Uncharacterized protein n=1 Tax=Mycena rosella TaxID=1033263 RepID=A0AAD7DMX8_MYCRO|nr:hypothetical protein B0H17DRAFT_1054987 [Mycena rosella]